MHDLWWHYVRGVLIIFSTKQLIYQLYMEWLTSYWPFELFWFDMILMIEVLFKMSQVILNDVIGTKKITQNHWWVKKIIVIITVPAYGLALLGARISAGTVPDDIIWVPYTRQDQHFEAWTNMVDILEKKIQIHFLKCNLLYFDSNIT